MSVQIWDSNMIWDEASSVFNFQKPLDVRQQVPYNARNAAASSGGKHCGASYGFQHRTMSPLCCCSP
jgi:hypothetical protein